MFSSDAIVVATQLLFHAPVDGLGKAWLGDVRRLSGLSRERFEAAVLELGDAAAVVLSRDDMTQRPDAETIGDCQRIELAPEAK